MSKRKLKIEKIPRVIASSLPTCHYRIYPSGHEEFYRRDIVSGKTEFDKKHVMYFVFNKPVKLPDNKIDFWKLWDGKNE
jgi:hypothetical protein